MKTSENISELSTSLIKLQGELENIGKDSSGYGYKYTSLDKLLEYLRPLLSKNNLGVIQTPTNEDTKIGVTTRLIHISGQYIEDTLLMEKSTLAKMNDYQVAGSIISYFRRYAISSIMGIASDDDIDVNIKPIEDSNKPKQQPKSQVKPVNAEVRNYTVGELKDLAEIKVFDLKVIETAYKKNLLEFTQGQLNSAYAQLLKK